jgi:hypothetical protein
VCRRREGELPHAAHGPDCDGTHNARLADLAAKLEPIRALPPRTHQERQPNTPPNPRGYFCFRRPGFGRFFAMASTRSRAKPSSFSEY